MSQYNVSPVREQIRSEMLAALANGAALSATDLFTHCPSAPDSSEIARIAHDMKRSGLLQNGEKVLHPLGMRVFTYCLPTTADPRLEAAKPIKVERKIPKTGKSNKPRASNPYAQFSVSKPKAEAPRVTRDLPIHLQSAAPIAAQEAPMSQEPAPYIVNPPFALEPSELESLEGVDSELAQALFAMSQMDDELMAKMTPLPVADDDDPVEMASADVGEIAQALKEKKTPEPLLSHHANKGKVCQCLRIHSLPPLPKGYIYGGIKVWIESEHDIGRMTIATHDEGAGVFCSLKGSGRLSFDPGDLVAIGQVADALIKLHESMGDGHE